MECGQVSVRQQEIVTDNYNQLRGIRIGHDHYQIHSREMWRCVHRDAAHSSGQWPFDFAAADATWQSCLGQTDSVPQSTNIGSAGRPALCDIAGNGAASRSTVCYTIQECVKLIDKRVSHMNAGAKRGDAQSVMTEERVNLSFSQETIDFLKEAEFKSDQETS
jgi:hypothetical protein